MKTLNGCLLLMLITGSLYSGKILEELGKPLGIYAGEKKFYIYDGSDFCYKIYDLDSLKLIGKFGKRGEGPGEFRGTHEVTIYKNELVLSGGFSLFRFSQNGSFISQKKTTPFIYYKPISESYSGYKIEYNQKSRDSYHNITIYDQDLKPVKVIYRQLKSKMITETKNFRQDYMMINPLFSVETWKDKIYIADCRKGFFISVYDSTGVLDQTINKILPKVEISKVYREKVMKDFKRSRFWIENKRNFNFAFPEFHYEMKAFKVRDDRIYSVTFKKNQEKNQLLIMDLKGNILKQKFITFQTRLYDFKNGKYYYLEDTGEEWELKITKL